MEYEPDFERYSLDEILDSQRSIDRNKYPERAKLIDSIVADKLKEHSEKKTPEKASDEEINENVKYKTFWRRVVAVVIDGITLILLYWLMHFLVSKLGAGVLLNYIEAVFVVVYSIVLHTIFGQTVGKMVMNVKVVDNKTKSSINLKQAF